MSQQSQDSRDRILDSTARVLVRDGGDGVTIAAVAKEAGLSKGGLFYHFASKDLLMQGLVDRYVSTFNEFITTADNHPGQATRAYLQSAEESAGPASKPVVALLAASVVSPAAMETLRDTYQRWQDRLDSDGIPSHVASIIRFAVDGMWMADTLNLAPSHGSSRQQIIAELRTLIPSTFPTHG